MAIKLDQPAAAAGSILTAPRRKAGDWPNIQRVDDAGAFEDDSVAAFHVVCAAAFDAGLEGQAARVALRHIVRFGEKGLNPIATMLGRVRR